jgi:hypothetical protein
MNAREVFYGSGSKKFVPEGGWDFLGQKPSVVAMAM